MPLLPKWGHSATLRSVLLSVRLCYAAGSETVRFATCLLPDKSSIFKAELHAISLALAVMRRSKEKNFIIFFRFHVKLGSYKWI